LELEALDIAISHFRCGAGRNPENEAQLRVAHIRHEFLEAPAELRIRHDLEALRSIAHTFLLTLLETLLCFLNKEVPNYQPVMPRRGGDRTSQHHASLLHYLLISVASMNSDAQLNYSELSDAQLRSALRFAEERIRWMEEDHMILLHSYRDEVATMRRHLVDRILARMAARGARLSREQYRDVGRAFGRHGMTADDIAILVRSATKGRSDRVDALTEIEAMAVLLRLDRHL
jgi:hypothetical protein